MANRLGTAVAVVVSVAIFGAGWYFLAPPQLGGKTSYAVTFGISMEPHFHHGDLVVLRRRSSYSVGDVVAYRSHELHKDVLHRIVAIHGGRFTFKGDNNGFLDPERPTATDLVGSEWLHVPTAGGWLASLHSPRYAAVASFLIVLLLVLGGGGTATRRRRGDRSRTPQATIEEPRAPATRAAPSAGFVAASAGAGALCAAAILGMLAYTKPLERSVVWANLYVQHGRFAYSAKVDRGAAYQGTTLRSGDPVYLQLVRRLPVAFAYRLRGAAARDVAGRAGLKASLSDDQGWRHTLVLARVRRFAGSATTVRGVLDLGRLEHVIAEFEHQTGEHNALYHLTLAAHVAVHATVASRPLATTFASSLAFDLDGLHLAVAPSADPNAPADPFTRSAGGAGTRMEPAYLKAFGRGLSVAHARRLVTLLGIAGLLLAGAGGLLMLLGRRGHETAAILRRYDGWIVDVMRDPQRATDERRVSSMDALARIAERYERLILHEQRGDADAFLVEDDGVVYAYVVRNWDRPLVAAR